MGFVTYIMISVIEQMLIGMFFFGRFGGGMAWIYFYWLISALTWIVGTLVLQRLILRKIRSLAAHS